MSSRRSRSSGTRIGKTFCIAGEAPFPIPAKTRYVRPRTLLGALGNAAPRPVRRQCRTRRRKSRQYSDLCCIACGTSFPALAVVEGASIKWLLQVWDCFSVLYDGLSAVGYLSNGGLFLPYCEDAQHQSFRSLSDLPGRAD